MNSVVLIGRMVADPEMKYANNGTTIAKFRIAVPRKFKREGQPDADFFSCDAFGKTADFMEKYFKKGMKVALMGSIHMESYKNKNGEDVYAPKIAVDSVEFVESKQAEQQPAQNPAPENEAFMNIPDGLEDELPFA